MFACSTTPRLPVAPPIESPADLIRRVTESTDSLHTARSRARVSLEIDDVRQKASSVLFYESPSELRMEINGTLGVNILSAKFWSDSLRVYLPGDKGYVDGPAGRVLYQITGMDLSFYDLPHILLGIPRLSPHDKQNIVAFNTTSNDYVLELMEGVLKRKIWVDRNTVTVRREDITGPHGRLLSRMTAGGHTKSGSVVLPGQTRIDQGGNHIEWKVESMSVNAGIDPSVFTLNMPKDVTRLE